MNLEKNIRLNIRLGILLSYLTIIVGIIVTIFYTPFLIAHVGKVEYGIYTFVSSIVSWFSILTVGIAGAYVRFATKYHSQQLAEGVAKINSAFSIVLFFAALVGVAGGLITFGLLYTNIIPLNSYSVSEKNLIFQLLLIGIAHLLFSFVIIFFNAFNTYKNNFIVVRGIALLIVILNPLITLPFLLIGGNVITVSLVKFAVDVFALTLYLLFTFFSKRKLTFKKFDDINEKKNIIKDILSYCMFIMIYVTIDTINKSSDKLVLGFLGLPTMVSIYGLGRAFLEYAYLATVYISANYVQIINQKITDGKPDEVNQIFVRLSNVALLLMFFIFGGFLLTGETFVHSWLANSRYTQSELNQLYWIALALIFVNIVPFSQVIAVEIQRGYNKQLKPTIIILVNAIINILLTLTLILLTPRSFAIWACLISTVATTFITHWVILNIFYKYELMLDVKTYFFSFIRKAFTTLLPVLATYLLYNVIIELNLSSGWLTFLIIGITYTGFFISSLFLFERKNSLKILSKLINGLVKISKKQKLR